jgi:hypothetical protein
VILNRYYKPLGIDTHDMVDYLPWSFEFARMGPSVAAKLSWRCAGDIDNIWLYNDGCVPTSSAWAMAGYLERLAYLMSLKLKTERCLRKPHPWPLKPLP